LQKNNIAPERQNNKGDWQLFFKILRKLNAILFSKEENGLPE